MKTDIKSLSFEELSAFLKENGFMPFKAKQIFAWLSKGVKSFGQMTDISKKDAENLENIAFISSIERCVKLVSKIDKTVKYAYRLSDGETIETVVMKYKHGNTICISSQVGCRMGCKFCASTIGGLKRNLTAAEMLDQIIESEKDIGERIDNIVIMGIGEPLDNIENIIKFLYNVNNINGKNIGMRHISLSTCGLVPEIERLAKLNLQITLSVSLHAPSNDVRSEIMPINRKYPIEELLSACREYIKATGRRISFEYAAIAEVNDTPKDAENLAKVLKGILCHVNIIPINNVKENEYKMPEKERLAKFCDVLSGRGIPVTIRRRLGADINASCGQLRREIATEEEN